MFDAECDQVFGSKWLINELYKFRFSVSCSKVTRFKQSIIQNASLDELNIQVYPKAFTQFAAENVDHIVTIDGKGTFHGMGIIAMSLPRTAENTLPKRKLIVNDYYWLL